MKLPFNVEDWSPLENLFRVRDEINRLFQSGLSPATQASQWFDEGWVPTLDLYEDRDTLTVRVELPGMRKEDIQISLHEGSLTIAGQRKPEEPPEQGIAYRSERFFGRFHRNVALPKPVDPARIEASYRDGILSVRLPKAEEAKPRQIEIQAA